MRANERMTAILTISMTTAVRSDQLLQTSLCTFWMTSQRRQGFGCRVPSVRAFRNSPHNKRPYPANPLRGEECSKPRLADGDTSNCMAHYRVFRLAVRSVAFAVII